jgi:predicted transposase YdaD
MCKALEELEERGREKGRIEGRVEGAIKIYKKMEASRRLFQVLCKHKKLI